MISPSPIDHQFFNSRTLPPPISEYRPSTIEELFDLILSYRDTTESLQFIGNGFFLNLANFYAKHVPIQYTAIRTTSLNNILTLDRESALITVEAGITWQHLQAILGDEGYSLERYNLYPAHATIGGLLARQFQIEKPFHHGDIRDGCVALTAFSRKAYEYQYLAAPRKASGPDFRYRYIGHEGTTGVIISTTLVIWRPQPGALYRWHTNQIDTTIELMKMLFNADISPSWAYYNHHENQLLVAIHNPAPILHDLGRYFRTQFPGPSPELIGDATTIQQTRLRLENKNPCAHLPISKIKPVILASKLSDISGHIHALEKRTKYLEIHHWTPQYATIYATVCRDGNDLDEND